jgi:hypothetical protein
MFVDITFARLSYNAPLFAHSCLVARFQMTANSDKVTLMKDWLRNDLRESIFVIVCSSVREVCTYMYLSKHTLIVDAATSLTR